MCYPAVYAVVMAAAAVADSMQQSARQRAQRSYQSDMAAYQSAVAANNAQAMRWQAENERRKGEIEQEKKNQERDQLRRDYEDRAAKQRSLLAAGGVDMASGSAADSLLGDASMFAGDMQINRHNYDLIGWDYGDRARQAENQARQYDAGAASSQASAQYHKNSADVMGQSLLSAGIKGWNSALSNYGTGKRLFRN